MSYRATLPALSDAQRVTLDGTPVVVFSDGHRAHVVPADVFDLFYAEEAAVVLVGPVVVKRRGPSKKKATKAAKEWNAYARKKNAKHAPAVKAAQAGPPPAVKPVPIDQPGAITQEAVLAILKVGPLDYCQLLEQFQVQAPDKKGQKALSNALNNLRMKGLAVAPPMGSGESWTAA